MRNRYPVLLFLLVTAVFLVVRMRADYSSTGLTVHVSVQATDSSGGTLHYAWRSTDGSIQNVDLPTTSWTLPQSTGIHFAYVLVRNGLGGYTERRILVNTDTLLSNEVETDSSSWTNPYVAPAASAQVGDYFRGRIDTGNGDPAGNDLWIPDVSITLNDGTNNYGPVVTDLKGEFVVPGVLPSTNITAPTCVAQGVVTSCFPDNVMLNTATSHYLSTYMDMSTALAGTFILADGSPCGTLNEFFGVHVTAQASLVDASNNVLAGPIRVNEFGDYTFLGGTGAFPTAAAAVLTCEGAPAQVAPLVSGSFGVTTLAGITPPTVTGMTATLHGSLLPATVAKFLPPPSGLPSDIAPRADVYLSEKGVDSRLGACKYYLAIGAVRGCGPNGELSKPITFHDWQRAVRIGKYASSGVPTYHAAYINKVDLNLARVHQSVSYGPNDTAAVVCNHVGATDFFNPTQSDIDTSVLNAVNNKALVACVAMDYIVSPGVNGGQPFVRFLIFGPSGQLLPSVNLDGRREKFVPGTCVVCHGGDHYAGKFPEDGSGFANVGARFLPYDVGNFEFASASSLTKCAQEDQIYHLNQNVLNAGPNVAENELIPGWYATPGSTVGSVSCPSTTHHVLDEDYVPTSWQASGDPIAIDYYKTVNARSCRTCHVAMIEGYNFDHYANIVNASGGTDALPGGQFDFDVTVCGGQTTDYNTLRWYTMPNSLVTYNRFWLSQGNSVGQPDQVASFINFANDTQNSGFCVPTPPQ